MEHEIDIVSDEGSEDLYERKAFKVDKGQVPLRIDKFAKMHLEGATRNKVQNGIEAGFLTVNGKQLSLTTK